MYFLSIMGYIETSQSMVVKILYNTPPNMIMRVDKALMLKRFSLFSRKKTFLCIQKNKKTFLLSIAVTFTANHFLVSHVPSSSPTPEIPFSLSLSLLLLQHCTQLNHQQQNSKTKP